MKAPQVTLDACETLRVTYSASNASRGGLYLRLQARHVAQRVNLSSSHLSEAQVAGRHGQIGTSCL